MCKDAHQKMILNPSNLQDHVVQKIIEYLEEKLEKLKYLKKKEIENQGTQKQSGFQANGQEIITVK